MTEGAACSVGKCSRPVRARGLCSLHYKRQLRGAPLDWKPKGKHWHRARASGINFSIDTDWLVHRLRAGVCEVTGISLKMEQSARTPWSASLDRIQPHLGYTKENTRVVCWMLNAAKGNYTDDDVLTLARALVERASAAAGAP